MLMRTLFFAALAAGAAVATQAAPGERVFDVTGVVRAPLSDGRVLVAHEAINGFMPAMTMPFHAADPAEAVSLRAGDRVMFRLHVSESASAASDFIVTGRDAQSTGNSAAPPSPVTRLREGDPLPALSLLDENGARFTEAAFRGRLTVVTFIYTRCAVPEFCPAMALRFAQLQKAIAADPVLAPRARLLSITLDPDFDQPEVLKAYGAAVGANPAEWHFATGNSADVASLARSFAVFTERNGITLDHTLCTALIDADGRIAELWRGGGWHADEVLASLREHARGIVHSLNDARR